MPTAEQIENFANYVSHAHSWYKHLPLFPPGEMFYFFRDKYAACDVVEPQNGVAKIVKRTEPGFHYSDLPTEEFRTRVGCLGFSCVAGTSVRLNNGSPPRDKLPTVLGDDAVLYRLPQEITDAGGVSLTAVIHTLSAAYDYWDTWKLPEGGIQWPEESGGEATITKIFDRCREMREPNFKRDH
jgi:hypothetical protein